MSISFLSAHAVFYERQLIEKLDELPSERDKLAFIIAFVNTDRNILGQMLEKTREWKINMNCRLYQRLYDDPTTSKPTKMLCISYLLSREKILDRMVDDLLRWVRQDGDWDAFDILNRFSFLMTTEQSDWLEGWMHTHRFQHPVRNEPVYPVEIRAHRFQRLARSIYDDSQNVHDTAINESVWKNIDILVSGSKMLPPVEFEAFMDSLYPLNEAQLRSLQRIETDRSHFRKSGKTLTSISVTLMDVFECLARYIVHQDQETQRELRQRLREELQEMSEQCATGHLSRLVNVLLGFHPEMEICIRREARVKAVFMNLLEKKIMQEDHADALLCDMMNPRPDGAFSRWMKKNSEFFIHELRDIEPDADLEKVWKELYPALSNPFTAPKTFSFWQKIKSWFSHSKTD